MSDNRPLALVTGASAGLGEIFARKLAARGYDLVICARRLEKLEALGAEIANGHGCMVKPVAADLSTREGVSAPK